MKRIIILTLFIFMIFINVSYAVEKPTYEDFIRSKYDRELTDEQVEKIIRNEELLKSIREIPEYIISGGNKEKEKVKEEDTKKINLMNSFYGNYPAMYVGVLNFKRNNFLSVMYSLRDISTLDGMQPIVVADIHNKIYKKVGFDTLAWQVKDKGLSSLEMIKWGIYQFEPMKLFRRMEDNTVVKALYEGKIKDYVSYGTGNQYVAKLSSNNQELINMKPGDILLYVEDSGIVSDYGIYLGKDKEGDYYGLSAHKNITNINIDTDYDRYNYFTNVLALSYINSTKTYPQDINGVINLISGTKYNYIVKMKYLE